MCVTKPSTRMMPGEGADPMLRNMCSYFARCFRDEFIVAGGSDVFRSPDFYEQLGCNIVLHPPFYLCRESIWPMQAAMPA